MEFENKKLSVDLVGDNLGVSVDIKVVLKRNVSDHNGYAFVSVNKARFVVNVRTKIS